MWRPRTAAGPARCCTSPSSRASTRPASIRSSPISGPRSSTRSAPSTRARSRTCCAAASRCYRDARDQGLAAAERVAAILAAELAWTPARRERALLDYRAAVERSRRWREEPARDRHRIVITPSTARSLANSTSTSSAVAHGTFRRWLTYLPCADGCRS